MPDSRLPTHAGTLPQSGLKRLSGASPVCVIGRSGRLDMGGACTGVIGGGGTTTVVVTDGADGVVVVCTGLAILSPDD